MSHKLYFSLNSMSSKTEDFFKTRLPTAASSSESKYKLKSPARIIILFFKSSNVCSLRFSFSHVKTCSISMFGLYRLIKMKTPSSVIGSNIKKRPFSSFFFYKSLKDLFSIMPIKTPHESVFLCEKKSSFLNSSFHFFIFTRRVSFLKK